MADLNVEKKRSRLIWPWLLVPIALAVLFWWRGYEPSQSANPVLAGDPLPVTNAADTLGLTGDTLSVVGGVPAASVEGAPGPVNDYLSYAAEQRRRGTQPISAAEVSDGIRRLAAGLEAAATRTQREEVVVAQRGDSLRGFAALVQREPNGIRQAELTHRAFLMGATMLQGLPPEDGGAAAAANANSAAQAVLPQVALEQQGEAVRRYFDASASALQVAALRPPPR